MSESFILEWVCLIVLSIFVYLSTSKVFKLDTDFKSYRSISDIALQDLSLVGTYNNRLSFSVKTWIYSIEAFYYNYNIDFSLLELFIKWNDTYNCDAESIIYNAIQEGHTTFLSTVEQARENKVEPDFKISSKFDPHRYPLIFKCNDYISPDFLLKELDERLES